MKPQAAQPKKQEAIVKPQADPLAPPDYLSGISGNEGFEEMRPSDVKVPRLALAQALTPQLNEDDEKFIPGLKKGDYFNTLTGKNYGNDVKFVPLLKFANRFLFRDMNEGGGILCRSDDMKVGVGEPGGECAKCPLAQFGSARGGEGKGTACSEFYNYAVLIVEDGKLDVENLAIFAMKSSHIPAAQHLMGLAMRRKLANGERAPMWAGVYSATSKNKKFTEKLAAYIPIIDNAGWVPQADVKMAHDSYEFMHNLRKAGRLTTDIEEEPLPEEPGASDKANGVEERKAPF